MLPYGEAVDRGGVRVAYHPAGHVLGSAQVRLEHAGEIWVVTGDYKLERDPTCTLFEPGGAGCRVLDQFKDARRSAGHAADDTGLMSAAAGALEQARDSFWTADLHDPIDHREIDAEVDRVDVQTTHRRKVNNRL